jgi:Lhr-like helicase
MTAIRLQDTGTTITDNWACFVTETRKEMLDIRTANTFYNSIRNPRIQVQHVHPQSSSPFSVVPSL